MKGKRAGKRIGQGVIGREVRVKGMRGTWKVTNVGGLCGANGYGTLQVSREDKGRVWVLGVNRRWVKFVRRNYEAKIERALKTDKAFRDFVEIAPCGHRGCGIPCKRWSVES